MQKLTCRVPIGSPASAPLRVDQAIAESKEAADHKLPKALIRKLIMVGAVYVNGKQVRVASRPLKGGEVIEIYWDQGRAFDNKAPADKFLPLRVLYEDEAVICFEKPAGLPTQQTLDQTRANLYDLARTQLGKGSGKPAYLGMHHRLDRDTSGVLLFTRDTRYNAHVADQFKSHKISKVYVAVVHGTLENPKGRHESFLAEVGRKGKQAKFGSVKSGGKKAITDFLVLANLPGPRSLVEVSILTGRTHQIRVHFSEAGHPIVGDTLYGSPVENYSRLGRFLLHAHALTFEHPITHNLVRVESPVPPEFRK